MTTTPQLIDSLAAELPPVRRLRPPLLRALAWLGGFLALLLLVTWATGSWPLMLRRLSDHRFALEMGATFATGAAAVIAAFYLSLPDRSRLWTWVPVPMLLIWLSASGYGCYRNWLEYGPQGWQLGRSSDCFVFIVSLSIPVAAALFVVLRRALPLDPLRVMVVAGLGVAGLSATALQFYHPFDVTIMDLVLHASAVLIVVLAMGWGGRAALKSIRIS